MDSNVHCRISGTPIPTGLIPLEPALPARPERSGPQPRPECRPRPP